MTGRFTGCFTGRFFKGDPLGCTRDTWPTYVDVLSSVSVDTLVSAPTLFHKNAECINFMGQPPERFLSLHPKRVHTFVLIKKDLG